MKSYPVTATPAYCQEGDGPQCYAFSVLGNDAPLYTMPQDQVVPASELTLPVAIRRLAFQQTGAGHPPPIQASPAYYGAGRSLAIYAPDWPKKGATQPIPVERIVPADLSGWTYKAERGTVAVDPATGRILFPTAQLPKQGVYVDYHYGFVADIGGGEYARPILQPTLAEMARFQRRTWSTYRSGRAPPADRRCAGCLAAQALHRGDDADDRRLHVRVAAIQRLDRRAAVWSQCSARG
jgi:hypothetical protein